MVSRLLLKQYPSLTWQHVLLARANANLAQNPGVPVRKIGGVGKSKNDVIVINDDSSDEEEDDYDTGDTEGGMPKMQQPEYDLS